MKTKKLVVSIFAAGILASPLANATNGYFSHGYGMKAKGMGGAATAMAIDAMGGANNPASMVWVGDRLDVGIDWFSPKRGASRTGSFADFTEESTNDNFFVPEFGYNHMMSPVMSLGVTVYGNGGMNTSYTQANSVAGPGGCGATPTNPLCIPSKLGMNLEQLIVAPTLAYKLNETNSIGISPLIGYQRFGANGLGAFAPISSDPANLTDNGYDSSTGWGIRFGWQGKMSDSVTLGAAYSTKMKMGKFDKYRGLFAEQGGFDIPENFNLGIALKATDSTTIAADYQRINYGDIPSVANPSTQPGCPGTGCLGGSTGIGFGWSNVNVFKIGVMHQYNDYLTVSAGFDHSDNPIQARDTTFNIIAPGVVQDHLTAGITYAVDRASEINVSYMHAMKNKTTGVPNVAYFNMGGTEELHMYQNSLGISYGVKF
ncbi:MAG TPA: outer membrane protein transport protein [Gallionella sp.]|jgi:long-chain fatty acid transport protein|nr:outer membrane protein transport protein [Gallionella sp.]